MAGAKSAAPVFLLLSALLLAAGGGVVWNFGRSHPSLEPLPTTGQLSQSVEIDVYVDASGSMKHFLSNDGRTNTFREFLRNCEFALKSGASQGGWDQEKRRVRFWRFGPKEGPQRLDKGEKGNEGALRGMAEDPNQFNAPDTPIESAINAEAGSEIKNSSRVRILVTDLYQSDGKLEKPAMALGTRFLSKADGQEDGAVAIYGVRNPFQGAVGDLPGQGETALPNAATSMPFYIIIAGDHAADVRQAQELLTGGEYGAPLRRAKAEGRLFAAYFSKRAGLYAREPVTYDVHVAKARTGARLQRFSARPLPAPLPGQERMAQPVAGMERKLSARVPVFEQDHRAGIASLDLGRRLFKENTVGVSWEAPSQAGDDPILQPVGVDAPVKTQWRVRAQYCESAKPDASGSCPGPAQVDEKAARGIHVCNLAPSAEVASVCEAKGDPGKPGDPALAVTVDRSFLTKGREYLVEFDLVSDAEGQMADFGESADLMRRWNLNPDEVHDLLSQPPALRVFAADRRIGPDEHPGKTPNLSQLLSALQGFVLSSGSGSKSTEVNLKTYFLYLNAM